MQHDGASFRVLLYLDNAAADESTGRSVEAGFAAEFPVLAHGDCWGDAGHCEADRGPVSSFDRRPLPPLTPIAISVEITDALKRLEAQERVTVTALALSTDAKQTETLRFGRLHLLTYD